MGDITAFVEGDTRRRQALQTENFLKSMKREVKEKRLKLSITGGGKEGARKVVASCSYLEEAVSGMHQHRRSSIGDTFETLGVDLRTRRQLGAKEKGEEEKVRCEVFACQENQV